MVRRKKKQQFVAYGVFAIFACFVLIAGQYVPRDNSLSRVVSDALTPVFQAIRQPISFYHDTKKELRHYILVKKNNDYLRAENAKMYAWRDEALHLRRENKQLKELLNMTESNSVVPIAGRVMADTRSPYARSVLIDIGHRSGVEKGQAVLSTSGLAGRVLEVGRYSSRVLLLSDHNARIPVKLAKSNTLAIVRGGNARRLELILVDGDNEAEIDELVVTSGVGGVFAAGIPVARVASIDDVIKVIPLTNFATLDKVIVHKRAATGIVGANGSFSKMED